MARPRRPERNRTARSFRQLRRFHHVINSDKVFGTHKGLPDTAEFGDLVEDEDDGFLDTAIGILLEPVADLHEADRGSDDEFAAPGLLIAGRQGTLAQKIELILVEAAL